MGERSPTTWMPIYWGDYAKDTGHFSAAQHGAYLMLIKHYWVSRAPLPDDDNQLWRIACADSIAHWRKLKAIIKPFFKVAKGVWRHSRIDKELGLANTRQEQARDAARRRWEKERAERAAADASAYASALPAQCSPICGDDANHNSYLTVTDSDSGKAPLGLSPEERSSPTAARAEERLEAQHARDGISIAAKRMPT